MRNRNVGYFDCYLEAAADSGTADALAGIAFSVSG
jgi:hypothetical protein